MPWWLRRLSEGRKGQRREFNDRVNRVIQKIVGWGFLVLGTFIAVGAFIQGISDLSRGR